MFWNKAAAATKASAAEVRCELVWTALLNRRNRFGYEFTAADVERIIAAVDWDAAAWIDTLEAAVIEFEKPYRQPWEAALALGAWQDVEARP